jgi:hypothetical protein
MKLTRTTVAVYASLVFGSGVVVGVFGQRLYTVNTVVAKAPTRSDEWRKRYTAEMQTRLHLKADQLSNLNRILDDTRTRFHEVRERSRPELENVRLQQIEKIRGMLDESQRAEYDKMRAERERNMQREPKRDPGL